MSRHTVTCAEADSNWPIVPDWSLRRCTTGFMLAHKLSVSQCSHLALAQRHCGAVRGRARPRRLSLAGRGNCPLRTDIFFLCGPVGPHRQKKATGDGCGPRPSRSSRADRAVALCYQADGSGPTLQPRPPRCSRWRRAVQVRCRCATRPRRSALVDSGACSIRSGARMQLGMRKGDHDMVHGLACMRGCSLVVQRVERGANFKNRV